jgi:hypothetical protein
VACLFKRKLGVACLFPQEWDVAKLFKEMERDLSDKAKMGRGLNDFA